jgi:transcriptional regulator with XRE-family HTH domain
LMAMGNNRDEKLLKKLGDTIKKMRLAKGFTTREFANIADIAYSQVWKIERGHVDPSLTTLLAIARTLEVKVDKLIPQED